MKVMYFRIVIFILLFSFQINSAGRDYNVWYARDGILYGLTQTADSRPVLISISSLGLREGGMVITFQDQLSCDEDPKKALTIDSTAVSYELSCIPAGSEYIKTYTITDPGKIKYVLSRLRSDFTVVLSGDIKIWAGNIKKPLYGTGSLTE